MWILILLGGAICAFGLLSIVSNERIARVQRIADALRVKAADADVVVEEIPLVGSPVPRAAVHVPQEEPILVR